MDINCIRLGMALTSGMLLGLVYFTGLWLTVRRLVRANRPAALLLISLAVRLGIVLTGFYIIMDERWYVLASAVIGFLLIRQILVYRLGPKSSRQKTEATEWT